MQIAAQISPLYKDLMEENFNDFVGTPAFERLYNKLDIASMYVMAHNAASKEPRDGLAEMFHSTFNEDLLGQLLTVLYQVDTRSFPTIITEMILGFLEWTNKLPSIKDILLDLESLGVSKELIDKIRVVYHKMESDLPHLTQLLKDIVTERAVGGAGDDKMYIRVRDLLVKNPITSPNLPSMIHDARNIQEYWTAIKTARGSYQERRQFINDGFYNLMRKLETAQAPVSVSIDEAYIHDIWNKALQRITTDPEGAITSARSLVETVCRHIIESKGLSYDETMDLNKTYKTAVTQLNLSPEQHTQPVFKQILSGCQSVVEGLGGLRNKYSDAHGKGSKAIKPSARHAELAVNLAGSMCSFLLQTLKATVQ